MTPRLLLLCLLLCTGGCSFRAPQLEGLVGMMRGGSEMDETLAAQAWTLEWLRDSTLVYPVVVDQLIVFTNASDLQVVFDGWQVLSAARLLPASRRARIEVSEERTRLRFLENATPVGDVRCEPWVREDLDDGAVRWRQVCEGLDEDNLILVDAAGGTRALRFTIHPAYPPIRLSRGSEPSS